MITEDKGVWRIWTAIKSKQVPPNQMKGTYLELHPDGSVIQRNNETEEEIEIMEVIR